MVSSKLAWEVVRRDTGEVVAVFSEIILPIAESWWAAVDPHDNTVAAIFMFESWARDWADDAGVIYKIVPVMPNNGNRQLKILQSKGDRHANQP